MAACGYNSPCRPCRRDGEFTLSFRHHRANVGNRSGFFCFDFRSGRGRHPWLKESFDPSQSSRKASFAQAFDDAFEMRGVAERQNFPEMIGVQIRLNAQNIGERLFGLSSLAKVSHDRSEEARGSPGRVRMARGLAHCLRRIFVLRRTDEHHSLNRQRQP